MIILERLVSAKYRPLQLTLLLDRGRGGFRVPWFCREWGLYGTGEAECADRSKFVRAVAREFSRSEEDSPQLSRQLLDARREVYRRADAGEIQTISAADIAVQNLAQMQRQAEA